MDYKVLDTQVWLNETYGHLPNFPKVKEDGVTGQSTFRSLIWALQKEVHITVPDGIFGDGTISALNTYYPTLAQSSNPNEETPRNIIYILQGSLWCKGISPGGFTGIFGSATANAIYKFQVAAGIERDSIVRPYILQGIMTTDSYSFRSTDDIYDTYRHEVQMGLNQYYGERIGLIAPNGIWERKSQRNLIKAVQIEWNATVDGIWGDGTLNKAPTISKNTSGYQNSKRILQWALAINGFYPGVADGIWGTNTYNAVYGFQDFLYLGADGICGKKTWASLLSSRGDTTRKANALDTSTGIQQDQAVMLYNDGYRDVGRYLCNTIGSTFNKTMSFAEIDRLKNAGLNVIPIFQTNGTEASYFTAYRGATDAARAITYAKLFGFPASATIYFAVDYDVLMADIEKNVVPYFRGVKSIVGQSYKVGAYGPRYVCSKLSQLGLITSSYVSNMSSGFTCNIGQRMPGNWAYDQFAEVSNAKSEYGIGYDKLIASSRKTATAPNEFVASETVEEKNFTAIQALYEHAHNYMISLYGTKSFEPLVFYANKLVLNYLRKPKYNGEKWDIIAGSDHSSGFLDYLATHHTDSNINLDPLSIFLFDTMTGINIEITHFAATLGSLLYLIVDFNVAPDRYVDAFAGWVGDMMQVGGTIGKSMELGGINYFIRPEDLKKCIGTIDGENDDLAFNYINSTTGLTDTHKTAGFDYIDLVQDLDAYNLAKEYSFYSVPLHEIFDDYYNKSRRCKKRYSIFEEHITAEYNKDTVYDIALMFATLDTFTIDIINSMFQKMFGSFNNALYGQALADAFAKRFEYYKSHE